MASHIKAAAAETSARVRGRCSKRVRIVMTGDRAITVAGWRARQEYFTITAGGGGLVAGTSTSIGSADLRRARPVPYPLRSRSRIAPEVGQELPPDRGFPESLWIPREPDVSAAPG